MFIVIEGDNGTGKDTLAKKLEESGFCIITYLDTVKEMEMIARENHNKTNAFLDYNHFCGNLAMEQISPSIVIRYWISTLAAAYADYVYEYDKVIQLTDEIKRNIVAPDVIIRIWVNSEVRLNRIASRNLKDAKLFDDSSIIRAQRYEWISKEILNRSGYRWREFDNTSVCIDELASKILDYIKVEILNE